MKTEESAVHDKAMQEVKEAIQAGSDLVYEFMPGRLADSDEAWPLILKAAELYMAQKQCLLSRQMAEASNKTMTDMSEAAKCMVLNTMPNTIKG